MDSKNLDAYIIQETHLSGDYTTILPKKNVFIHHGPETQPTKGAKGGVRIILSKAHVSVDKKWKQTNTWGGHQ